MDRVGMVRDLDSLGRIVIPVDIGKRLGIGKHTTMEFWMTESGLIMRQCTGEACTLCGEFQHLTYFKNAWICISCTNELKNKR
ncbi:AbrB/MazE/SpoVT family DNA-binding domain-containing protein [Paenibacillus peoriae]|uniref:AbrB/MazE/SpoVT family DNA-binding domain-containing protein n=1 Tax=Paenibacillus peoriae TaxID=59893 RepID=UPI003F9A8072